MRKKTGPSLLQEVTSLKSEADASLSGRVMPIEYWLRCETPRRRAPNAKARNKSASTLGPRGGTRGAHFPENNPHEPQDASATGSPAASHRRSHDADGML